MELLQLEYFVRIAEQGSFTNAAAQLHVAQPRLSRAVRSLEIELRANLFNRNGRGAQLTPAGHRFLDHARGVLRGTEAARQSVREGEAVYEGHVAVGLPPSIGKLLILPLVPRFADRFPRASISIVEGRSSSLYDQLLTGRLDFAVMRNPVASPHLTIEPITTEVFYLVGVKPVGPRESAVTLADLTHLRFIMPSAPHTFRPLLEAAMARMGAVLTIPFEVDAFDSLLGLVLAKLGYTICPESTMRANRADGRLSWQKIAAPELSSTICLVTPSRQPRTRLPLEAIDLVREVLTNELHLTGFRKAKPRTSATSTAKVTKAKKATKATTAGKKRET
jgi:LysR family nitrogen assimilation transcriptional regulator